MGTVRLSHLADGDLDDIREYIAERSPAAANRMLDEIFSALESLAKQPLIGQKCDDIQTNLRAFTVRSHVIFYSPSVDGICVARILFGARDFPALFSVEVDPFKE